MTFTDVLYKETQDIWQQYYDHPFIKGLENGDLDKEKFKYYMIQDYIYLWDYSKLFAVGALKSKRKDLIEHFSHSMHMILDVEMDIHRSYMERLGISEDDVENEKPSLWNTSYTNYMLSVAQSGGLIEVVSAILSCAWTYQEIARHIDENNSEARNHEFYGEWVKGYTTDEYRELTQYYIDLTNELCENLSAEEKQYQIEIFRNCCIYELKFWDMAWNGK